MISFVLIKPGDLLEKWSGFKKKSYGAFSILGTQSDFSSFMKNPISWTQVRTRYRYCRVRSYDPPTMSQSSRYWNRLTAASPVFYSTLLRQYTRQLLTNSIVPSPRRSDLPKTAMSGDLKFDSGSPIGLSESWGSSL